ncbi:unnamed protein product [Fusarium fujikuroi]|nr:unnamed protein product [Fusarium fujikuroi]
MVNLRRTTAASAEPDELSANPPGISSDSTQDSNGGSSRTATRIASRTTHTTRISALEVRIKQLEEELALQQRQNELEQRLRENGGRLRNPPETQGRNGLPTQPLNSNAEDLPQTSNDTSTRQQQAGNSSTSSSDGEVKAKNIITLEYPTTFRKRDEWLDDMDRSFEGARKRYRTDKSRILFARDNMAPNARLMWSGHLNEQTEERREDLKRDWEAFKEWSLTLVEDGGNRQILVTAQLENARQRPGQSPQDFHKYLVSIEDHLPYKLDTAARVYQYHAKLLPTLRDTIAFQGGVGLPETREELVQLAQRLWDASNRKNKRTGNLPDSLPPKKKPYQPREPPKSYSYRRPQENNQNHSPVTNPKEKEKDLSSVECYNCHKKGEEIKKLDATGDTGRFPVDTPKTTPIHDQDRLQTRFERRISTTVEAQGRKTVKVQACLDCGAETDTISETFARSQGFRRLGDADIPLQGADDTQLRTMGRWEITLTLTDCWGQTRKTTRSLIGIDKRDQDEPILLSIATLKDLRIVADFETRKWWFKGHHGGLELLKPRQKPVMEPRSLLSLLLRNLTYSLARNPRNPTDLKASPTN